MSIVAGKYFIDGMDFWTIFSMYIEKNGGIEGFLKYPAKKESITRNWPDSNGIDVDLSRVFFNAREVSLRCVIIANSEAEFWEKHEGFIYQWSKPGLHRIQIAELGMRSFYCFYRDCTDYDRVTRLQAPEGQKIACKFTLNIIEGEPFINASDQFIVDEEGRFLIT